MANDDPRQDLGSWSVVAGEPLSIALQINNPGGGGTNLTTFGSTWAAMARQSATQTTAQSFTVDATGAATGALLLSLTAVQTAAMVTGAGDTSSWRFDLQASGGAVTPQYPFLGEVIVKRAYTHG